LKLRKKFLKENGRIGSDGWGRNGYDTNYYGFSYMKGENSRKKMINSGLRLLERPISLTNHGLFERLELSRKY
jgi:hypothetical protein